MWPKVNLGLAFILPIVLIINSCGTNTKNNGDPITIATPEPQNPQPAKVLKYGDFVAKPLLIYYFMPSSGERPVIMSFNLAGGNNRFFTEHPIDATTADLPGGKGRFNYALLGQTTNNIYVVKATIAKDRDTSGALLFFSIRDKVMHIDTNTYHAPLITMEKYYNLGHEQNAQIAISGNKVTVDIAGAKKKYIELLTDSDNTSSLMEDTSYPPAGLDGSSVEQDWREADSLFYFHGSPINPHLVYELDGGGFNLSDGPDTRAVDIAAGSVSKKYNIGLDAKGTSFYTTDTSHGMESHTSLRYEYLGKTNNGVHVVRTIFWGGGSGVFGNIQFIRFRIKRGFDCNGMVKDQLLMCLERWDGELARSSSVININGNTVTINILDRSTPADVPTDTIHIVEKF